MGIQSKRSVVRELPVVRVRMRLADLRSAARECILNVDRRNGIVRVLRVRCMFKLKARFVNNRLIDDCCFGELNSVFALLGVVRA